MAKPLTLTSMALATVLLGGAAIGALGSGNLSITSAQAQPIQVQAPRGAPMSFADLIERVSPAVVSVNVVSEREVGGMGDTEEFFERFRGMPGFDEFMERRREENGDEDEEGPRTREGRSLGSGFFITATGHIVTNNHVIADATEIEVVLEDGRELDAELIGTDPQTDLAVIKVTAPGTYPFVKFSTDANLRRGDWVVALGNPFGLGGTATAGILSADGRDIGNNSPYTDFLQIDASINRGNSGGPTFDLKGNVIGVNTAIFSPTGGSVGIGFAIPSELAIAVTDQLIANGKVSRGWLGVTIQDVTDDMADALSLAEAKGAIVSDLLEGGPALKSGVKRGDVIVGVNGVDIADATGLTREVADLIAGSSNKFDVLRDNKKVTINVTIGERPENPFADTRSNNRSSDEDSDDDTAEGTERMLGLTLMPLDDDARERLGLPDDEKGLVITDVDRSSPLAASGVSPGMAVLEVNGRTVSTGAQYDAAIEAAKKANKVNVLMAIRVQNGTRFITADLPKDEE